MRLRALLTLSLALPAPGLAATLAGHHALYALTLRSTQDEQVLSASGTMRYAVEEVCGGWTTAQHLVIDLTNKDGHPVHMVTDYATFESKDGTRLDFHTKQTSDGTVTDRVEGTAHVTADGGEVSFTNPRVQTLTLPRGTLLPMAHTSALIDAAVEGEKFIAVPLFDGTAADGAQDSFVTFQNWRPADADPSVAWTALAKLAHGRVHIAFFNQGATTQTPDYQIGMRYFANGVSDQLEMNFGDFTLDGKMTQFELSSPGHC